MEHKTIGQHISFAFMKFIPLIIVYSVILVIGSFSWILSDIFKSLAIYCYYLLIPALSGLLIYSISGYKGVVYGFILGALADYLQLGFLGALLVGLSLGYLFRFISTYPYSIKWMRKQIVKDYVLPFFISGIAGLLLWFTIAPPIAYGLNEITNWLYGLQQSSTIILVFVLGALTASDLGGPLNKTSYAFTLGAFLEGLTHITGPAIIAASIPPLSIALALYIFPRVFIKEEQTLKRRTLLLGTVGITEGAIPFAVQDPLSVIPAVIIGSGLTTALAAYFSLSNTTIISALPGIIGTNNILLYILVHILGITFTASLIIIIKLFRKKGQLI